MHAVARELVSLVEDPLVDLAPFELTFRQSDGLYTMLLGDGTLQALKQPGQCGDLPIFLLNSIGT